MSRAAVARPRPQDADVAGAFHQSWFPLALARDVAEGQLLGRDFLGTRVILYRDPAQRVRVQSAYCPHLGADLSVGELIGGQVRCAYHHWRFDCEGRCVDIPTGDKIPPGARIFTYPSAEAWGLIWAFNGSTPLFPVPRMPDADEAHLRCEARFRGTRAVDTWVAVSNGVDFQHLRTLHGLQASTPETVTVGEHTMEYRVASAGGVSQHGLITGVNTFSLHLTLGGEENFMLFSGAPIAQGRTMGFYVYGVPASTADVTSRLEILRGFVERLLAEDAPVLDTIRFRQGTLVASDRHLARFFKYVRDFPRAIPLGA